MVNKKQQGTGKAIGGDIDFDIGLDDLDLSQFDVLDDDGGEEEQTRYIRPKVRPMRPERVKYGNAVRLAKELRLDFGARYDVIVSGDFIFGDFIEAFLTAAFTNASRHLKPGGAFYIWHADTEGLNFRTAVANAGLDLKQTVIWNKNALVLGRQDYQWKHEPCLYGWKPGAAHYFAPRRDLATVIDELKGSDIDKLAKDELKSLLERIFSLPATVICEDKPLRSADHPTMKPLPLMGRLIRNSTRQGEVVLDLFGGSGSTLMAAERLGRTCFMVELDPCYVDVIIKRWEENTGGKARLVGNRAGGKWNGGDAARTERRVR